MLQDGRPVGALGPDGVHSCGVSWPDTHPEKALSLGGSTKGGRRGQLESILAERCKPILGPNMKMTGQKKKAENYLDLSNLSRPRCT